MQQYYLAWCSFPVIVRFSLTLLIFFQLLFFVGGLFLWIGEKVLKAGICLGNNIRRRFLRHSGLKFRFKVMKTLDNKSEAVTIVIARAELKKLPNVPTAKQQLKADKLILADQLQKLRRDLFMPDSGQIDYSYFPRYDGGK